MHRVHVALVTQGSVSGVREGLTAALARRVGTSCVDIARLDLWRRIRAGLAEFHPDRQVWKRRTIRRLGGARGFDALSRLAEKGLRSLPQPPDAVLQVSGLFSSARAAPRDRFFLFCDYTAKLADRLPFDSAPRRPEDRAGIYEREQALYESASQVFVAHEVARQSFLSDYGLPESRVEVVGVGVRVDPLPVIDWSAERRGVMFVGRDFERHGGAVALEAMRTIGERRPGLPLRVVGAKVHDGGVRSWYRLPYHQLCRLYAQAGVLLVLARVGGLQTLLDGMAHGCACVALRGNPFAEAAIVHGHSGELIRGSSPQQIAAATLALLDDEDKRLAYGREGRLRVEDRLNWHRVAERMLPYILQQSVVPDVGDGSPMP